MAEPMYENKNSKKKVNTIAFSGLFIMKPLVANTSRKIGRTSSVN